MSSRAEEIAGAAKDPDWGQVVANGGPPCFHVDHGEFCLRAKGWPGHGKADHAYVPLTAALESYAAEERERCAIAAFDYLSELNEATLALEVAARIREAREAKS